MKHCMLKYPRFANLALIGNSAARASAEPYQQVKCGWVVYNVILGGRRGRKPGYIYEMGSHDLKSCEVKCQRNST